VSATRGSTTAPMIITINLEKSWWSREGRRLLWYQKRQ
jgi:hypothetical protein